MQKSRLGDAQKCYLWGVKFHTCYSLHVLGALPLMVHRNLPSSSPNWDRLQWSSEVLRDVLLGQPQAFWVMRTKFINLFEFLKPSFWHVSPRPSGGLLRAKHKKVKAINKMVSYRSPGWRIGIVTTHHCLWVDSRALWVRVFPGSHWGGTVVST